MTGLPPGGPPRALLAYVSAVMMADLGFGTALTPLLPRYAEMAGLSRPAAGILMGAYAAGGVAGAVPGGMLAARLGSRPGLQAGLAAVAAAGLVLGWSSSAVMLTGARFIQGVAGSCAWAGGLAWLSGAAPTARRGEVLGVAIGFAAAGAVAGPAAGALALWAGPGPVFTAAAAACGALAIAACFLPAPRQAPARILLPALRAAGDRVVLAGLLVTAAGGMAAGGLDVLAPLRLSRLGAAAAVLAGTWIAAGAAEVALSLRIGRLSDRLGAVTASRVLLAAAAAVLLAFPVPRTALWLSVLLAAGLPAFGSLCIPGAALLSAGADRRCLHPAVAFGLGNLAWSGGQAAAAMGAGAAAQAAPDAVPAAALAGMCLLALAVLRAGPRRRSRVAPPGGGPGPSRRQDSRARP